MKIMNYIATKQYIIMINQKIIKDKIINLKIIKFITFYLKNLI